ncbi:MAG: SMC-Scp complex subunit ScpB [Planctomycetes bacterium]|nr:SMC-Scp complex subunit ScpB [Planctomycetota bacterium]
MSIEHSDEQIEDVIGEVVEIDADSLAAAAQSAGISEGDAEKFENPEEFEELEEADDDAEEVELVTSICGDDGFEVTVESVVEAILFASDEPITVNRLVSIVETGSVKQMRQCVKNLNEKYQQNNLVFRIERIAGGYQMMTLDAYNHWLRKMIRVRADNKLTQAALETLAIIAYKQPIMRADVEGIRGVSSGEMIRSLMYKGLVRITGRAEVLGRPMLYGTTKKFLNVFGLNSPKDLPKLDELKKRQE